MLAKVKSPFRAKPGVAAHQLVCAVPFTYAAWVGARVWLYDAGIAAMDGATYVERLYGAHDASWSLCRFMIGFQIYDLLATGLEPSLRKAEHLAHHSATLLTALAAGSAGGPYFGYYGSFFFGFTEISSVPLFLVDLFRQLPNLAEGALGAALNEASRTGFAVAFLPIRCVWFPWVMVSKFWPDMYAAWSNADVRMAGLAFGWMAFSSAFLTFLQLFWGYKIIRVVAKGNLGGKDMKQAQKEA